MHVPRQLDRDEAPLGADETEQTALLELAKPCADSTIEYEPAS
ncbi:hypothetical protein [Streptomyces sp. gb14]